MIDIADMLDQAERLRDTEPRADWGDEIPFDGRLRDDLSGVDAELGLPLAEWCEIWGTQVHQYIEEE